MPVKKTQSKRPKKKASEVKKSPRKKSVPKRVHQDIERAIEKIPGLLTEHVRFEEPYSPDHDTTHPSSHKYMKDEQARSVEQQKRRLLTIGVVCLVSVILVMWVWNARVAIYSLVRSPQNAPWTNAKADFSSVMETLAKQDVELDKFLAAATPTSTATEADLLMSADETTTSTPAEQKLEESLKSLFVSTSTTTSTINSSSTTQ